MYETFLILHSVLRWAVVAAGLYALALAATGMASRRPWTPKDLSAHRGFVIALDVQFLVGLILYGVVSPLVGGAMANMGEAMKSAPLRYWLVEHPLPMLAAVALVHLGFARAKRTAAAASHRHMLLHAGVAFMIILATTPWPFRTNGRPWLRLW